MPTIISDKELKSLDHLLSEKECTWALEAEIDYTAKLDFSDNSSEDESEDPKKSTSTTNNSSSKSVIEPYMKSSSGLPNERSLKNSEGGSFRDYPPEDSNPPKGHTLGPSGPFRQDQNRNTYVGRKSDSVYEFNRKDSEVIFSIFIII